MHQLESLQRRASKFILNLNWKDDISYSDRLKKLNLLPFTYWQEMKDLVFYLDAVWVIAILILVKFH